MRSGDVELGTMGNMKLFSSRLLCSKQSVRSAVFLQHSNGFIVSRSKDRITGTRATLLMSFAFLSAPTCYGE
jgi:hypothetical protein